MGGTNSKHTKLVSNDATEGTQQRLLEKPIEDTADVEAPSDSIKYEPKSSTKAESTTIVQDDKRERATFSRLMSLSKFFYLLKTLLIL